MSLIIAIVWAISGLFWIVSGLLNYCKDEYTDKDVGLLQVGVGLISLQLAINIYQQAG